MQTVYTKKPENPDFTHIAKLFHVDVRELQAEWKILRRLPQDLSTQSAMIDFVTSVEIMTMFPTMSLVTRRILLLPIHTAATATVERSFSSMNRILCDIRSWLLADHTRHLMLLSIEGPAIRDIRDAEHKDMNVLDLDNLIDRAFKEWLKQPRRS